MKRARYFFLIVSLFLGLLVVYLYFFSPSDYQIDTPIDKGLVLIEKVVSHTTSQTGDGGFCAPPGCGPSGATQRENIKLELSDEQLTALLNALKPKSVLLSNMRVKFETSKVLVSATSYYPLLPGKITVISRLKLNHFYVDEVYVGGIRAPERTSNSVEANGNTLIDNLFQENDVFVSSKKLVDDKFVIEASVPIGKMKVVDGVIEIR